MTGQKSNPFGMIIAVVGIVLFLAFFGFVIFLIKQNKDKPLVLSSSGFVRGAASAKVTLVEYGDLQCPACKAYEPMVRQLSSDFSGKMKLLYKNFPLTSVHKNAMFAAKAAVAAGEQGKFWQLHDWLYDNQDSWGELPAADAQSKINDEVKTLGVNMDQYKKDLSSSATEGKINFTMNEGVTAGVDATPTFFLDNKKVDPTPQNYADFKKLVQSEIAKQK